MTQVHDRPRGGYLTALRNAFTGTVETITTPDQLEKAIGARNGLTSPDSAVRSAAVFACVDLLTRVIASRDISVVDATDATQPVKAVTHPVHLLLASEPNGWQTPYDFMRLLTACVLLRGNFYAQKVVRGDRVEALFPLRPDAMEVKQDSARRLSYEYRVDNGPVVKLDQSEVFHVRGFTLDGVVGIGVLDAARHNLEHLRSMVDWNRGFFKNGAKPSGVLQHPQSLTAEAFKHLKESFDTEYVGAENAGRPLILEEGLTWQSISITAEAAQFIETFKFSRAEIAMFFGVPPHMIGDIERGTSWGSGLEQQNVGFLTYRVGPELKNFAQAMRRDLLSREDRARYNIVFDTSELTRADFATRQAGLERQKRNGIISANEWRTVEGLNPRDGGDEYSVVSGPALAAAGNEPAQQTPQS